MIGISTSIWASALRRAAAPLVNLVQNGTFDTDTIWFKANGSTISGGQANLSAINQAVRQNVPGIESQNCQIKMDANKTSGTSLRIILGGTIVYDQNIATGLNNIDITVTSGAASDVLEIRSNGFIGSIDNVELYIL